MRMIDELYAFFFHFSADFIDALRILKIALAAFPQRDGKRAYGDQVRLVKMGQLNSFL